MSEKIKKNSLITPIALAVGTGLAISVATMPIANASQSPFQNNQLSQGYMIADNHEGNGHDMEKVKDGKCGGDKMSEDKAKDGVDKVSDDKAKDGVDKVPDDKAKDGVDKAKDGKCAGGKCGSGSKS